MKILGKLIAKTPARLLTATATRRTALCSLLLMGGALSTGCSTPGYSAKQRGQMIVRNMGLEWQMAQDDIDDVLLLRPVTTLSRWNVR